MLTVDLLCGPDGWITGFSFRGHAGYGEAGGDIVCAAVSSAAYLVVNTVTDVLRVTPLALRAEEGSLLFRVEDRDKEDCRTLFEGLRLHLLGLEEQYPGHLRVGIAEV